MIKTILFDNNGVLTTTEDNRIEDLIRVLDVEKNDFMKVWKEEAKQLDDGRVTTDHLLRQVVTGFGLGEEVLPEIKKIYLTFYDRVDDMHDVVRELSKRYQVALLSNFGDAFDEFDKRWRTHETFGIDNVFVSTKVGMRKPNRDFYEYALEKLGADPESTVFVDDRHENILAAEAIGIKGLLFSDKEQFLSDFNRIIEEDGR